MKPETGKISWQSPSNIALVKYWGKKPGQIPANPSLSMTLSKAYTELALDFSPEFPLDFSPEFPLDFSPEFPLDFSPGTNKSIPWLEFLFEGRKRENFEKKISEYLQSLALEYPVLNEYCFKISSSNTFPHSAGIASSASSMSALGLCLADFLADSGRGEFPPGFSQRDFASHLARLASGSACRSVYGGYVIWGHVPELTGTSDDFAIPVPFDVHDAFKNMKDAILVVNSKEKKISSRAGHSLMDGHPYADARYKTAKANLLNLAQALRSGDLEEFVRITESEALNLHALMMTSSPSYILIEPNTLNIVNLVREFRRETKIPVCFTLDAGPNIHLLYPEEHATNVKDWINAELVKFCENGNWIDDEMGTGPEKMQF